MLALNDVHQAKTKRGFADVYIRPPVEQYNILDFGAYQQIADIGYRSAMETLWGTERLCEETKTRPSKRSQAVLRPVQGRG